jgi:hypothetical protein
MDLISVGEVAGRREEAFTCGFHLWFLGVQVWISKIARVTVGITHLHFISLNNINI